MRQRNAGTSPLIVPDIPAEVAPGDEVDYPELITGLEPVTAPPAADKPAKKPTVKADSAPSTEGA